tara:strand:- start:222 stop:491 length:270 start_codon:yes stop_codon:yes gene_type:complete
MKTLLLTLSMVLVIDCARAGKNQDAEMLERLEILQTTIDSQSNTINSLTAQVSAQTAVIQQLANAETPDITIDNNVDGQLVCTWVEEEI